jgi:hypothetical protein
VDHDEGIYYTDENDPDAKLGSLEDGGVVEDKERSKLKAAYATMARRMLFIRETFIVSRVGSFVLL